MSISAISVTKAARTIRRSKLIVLIENNVAVHTDHGMIWLEGRSDEVRK
jgi:hypothetical protein